MAELVDFTGHRFHRLVIIARAPTRKTSGGHYKAVWFFRCDCGSVGRLDACRVGRQKSCGCIRGEKHGLSKSRIRNVWNAMIQRCHNPNNSSYSRYGGRGIAVCSRWRHSLSAFVQDMGVPQEGLTLERKNNSGPYSPDNCCWASLSDQANNRRSSSFIIYGGEKKTIAQWAKLLEVPVYQIHNRIKLGWNTEQVLFGKRKAHNVSCKFR